MKESYKLFLLFYMAMINTGAYSQNILQASCNGIRHDDILHKQNIGIDTKDIGGDSFEKSVILTLTGTALHNKLKGIAGASVTVCYYRPLVGIVEMIVPNGETTTYDYDTFLRLAKETDHNGVVIKSYTYNYKH